MIELGDAFIAFPGGTGTLEEITEVMSKVSLKRLDAPCILYNLNGYYNSLKELLNHMIEKGLSDQERQKGIFFADDLMQIQELLFEVEIWYILVNINHRLATFFLATDEIGLIGLWFEGQKYFANTLPDEHIPQETEILTETIKWLDMYFSGEEPNFTPPLHPSGSSFRQAVWQILLQIPYGQTITYGEIARKIAETKNTSRMSAQAVGGAVGHNEISIIIPCHRVVGTNGDPDRICRRNRQKNFTA